MTRRKMTNLVLAALVAGISGTAVLYAQTQDDERVDSPNAIHEQKDAHVADVVKVLSELGTPETPYDYISFALSGPVVVLQGFTVNGALRDNAKAQIQKLDWVTHVVQEVELLDVGTELKRVRRQILATLKKQVPQAFPQNHANIRIKVTVKGDVTLVGVIEPPDEKRYLAAVEQIKHVTFVGSVTDKVTKRS